jgi:hypothetical protein
MQTDKMKTSGDRSREPAERIQRVENGTISMVVDQDQPPLQLTLQKLMELYRVPGISVAVIDNFEIAWAKGYGVTELGTSNPVTTHTLFQSGSVSKPVAAAGALFLVQQGKLVLDEDVNHKLITWHVPENEFTQKQKVTLRRILSHTAGLTVHGFPGYDIDEPVPTVVQVLNGEPPANTEPVRVDTVPGTKWRYSGGGTVIAQQLHFHSSCVKSYLTKSGCRTARSNSHCPQKNTPWQQAGRIGMVRRSMANGISILKWLQQGYGVQPQTWQNLRLKSPCPKRALQTMYCPNPRLVKCSAHKRNG